MNEKEKTQLLLGMVGKKVHCRNEGGRIQTGAEAGTFRVRNEDGRTEQDHVRRERWGKRAKEELPAKEVGVGPRD